MTEVPTPEGSGATSSVSRRGLLTGLGAVGGGAVIAGLPQPAAAREPTSTDGAAPGDLDRGGRGTGIVATLASAPVTGVRYEFRSMWDFSPELASAIRAWGGSGVHTSGTGSTLWATFDLPPGASIYDIEWYIANSSGTDRSTVNRIWQAGVGDMLRSTGDTAVTSGVGIRAFRTVVGSAENGPFPSGCRAAFGLYTPTDGSVQINGVRIGYRQGAAAVSLLTTPVRAYDSRTTGGPLAPGATRTISLAGAIPKGAVGAVLGLSLTGCNGRGTLRLARAGATPLATAVQWGRTGDQVTTAANTAVDAGGKMLVKSVGSTGSTHVIVDVVGFLS